MYLYWWCGGGQWYLAQHIWTNMALCLYGPVVGATCWGKLYDKNVFVLNVCFHVLIHDQDQEHHHDFPLTLIQI